MHGYSDFSSASIECDIENLPNPEVLGIRVTHGFTTHWVTYKYLIGSMDLMSQKVRFYYSETINSEKKLFYTEKTPGGGDILVFLPDLFSGLKKVADFSSDNVFPNQYTYWIEAVDEIPLDESRYIEKNYWGTTSEMVEIPILKGESID